MNPHTNARSVEHAEEKCRLANERFGYMRGLTIALEQLGYPAHKVRDLLELARTRSLTDFEIEIRAK